MQLGIFDFVIRAEDVGVSKPDKRVYKADVAALMLRLGQDKRIIEEFFLGESFDDGIATDSIYMASETEITASTPHWHSHGALVGTYRRRFLQRYSGCKGESNENSVGKGID